MALSSCNVHFAPGLDGITYGVFLGLSKWARGYLLPLFNGMFVDSRFLLSWGDTLVTFVPKAGSAKFRTISLTTTLCKTF